MRVCAMAACAVVAAGMVLTGCGPAAPPTSGTPTVVGTGPTAAATPLCTPESGGSATPCTQQQYEEMKKLDALYAEYLPRLSAHSDAILLDRELYDRVSALRVRADAGEIEGYDLVYRTPLALVFVKENLCTAYFPAPACHFQYP